MTMRADLALEAPLPATAPAGGAGSPASAPAVDAGPAAAARPHRWVHGPWVDFLTLGGGSFLVLGAMLAFFPEDEASRVALAGAMLFLAHFVNHPHFAHSYQVFYRDFARKAFPAAPAPVPALAARYRFAGIMVPALLAAFFAVALAEGSVALLGLAGNVMLFTVGWHYAKQGYGILMLDAARKGVRFGANERRRLLWNTHLAWVTNWLFANDVLAARELWGITYYMIDVPGALLVAMAAFVAVSTLAVGRDLFAMWRAQRTLPVNGLLAWVAAVYVWLAVGRLDPVLLLVVPFFHSLQYMAVVWRYQLEVEADRRRARPTDGCFRRPRDDRWKAWLHTAPAGLARFLAAGTALGFAGFWLAPVTADALSGYDRAVFGATLSLFIAWTFINIHHYFIDNVIWRRENPEARRHLFSASGRPAPRSGRGGRTRAGTGSAGSFHRTPT